MECAWASLGWSAPLPRFVHSEHAQITTDASPLLVQDFSCGGDKFQDGAVTANNPAVIALQEAVRGCVGA